MTDAKENIKELSKLKMGMFRKNHLLTWEHSLDDIKAILLVTEIFEQLHRDKLSMKLFESGVGVSIFRDNSTRTRYSYAAACSQLGLTVHDLDENKSQIAHGETVRETINMLSFCTLVIGIRDDLYLGEGDKYQRQVVEAVNYGFDNGILHILPTVINLQSDIDHPTQSLSDLSKMKGHFGGLDAIKNKKIVMSWGYSPSYGKPLSVAQGMIGLMTRFGAEVVLAHPPGYDLLPDVVELSKKQAKESGGSFSIIHDMDEAFRGADVVCPKSWASLNVMNQRRDLLHAGDMAGLEELEKTCLKENEKYIDWECTSNKMALTNNALYMHPLPADISGVNCERGEVSKEVFDANILDTYHQASFKPFVIMAMIILAKIKDTTVFDFYASDYYEPAEQ